MIVRIAFIIAIAIGCKGKSESPPGSDFGPVTAKASATSGELAAMIPKLESAKVLSKKAPNDAYALETWCIDEADAIVRVTTALERDGWTNIHTRGEPPKQAIAAMKGDVRFSGRTGGGSTRCAGTYITVTVMRLGNIDQKLGSAAARAAAQPGAAAQPRASGQ